MTLSHAPRGCILVDPWGCSCNCDEAIGPERSDPVARSTVHTTHIQSVLIVLYSVPAMCFYGYSGCVYLGRMGTTRIY